MSKVLCVEDDADMASLMEDLLVGRELGFVGAETAAEAQSILETQKIDLILLDIGLPDQDGFHLCRILQSNPKTRDIPVIFITGNQDVEKKIAAFKMGADDYVVKPFNHHELLARIESRIQKRNRKHDELVQGPVKLSLLNQRVTLLVSGREKVVPLTRLEFKLLTYFVERPEQIHSREHLLKNVWGEAATIGPRTVDAHICSLRRKLAPYSHYVEMVTNGGYRFSLKAIKRIKAA